MKLKIGTGEFLESVNTVSFGQNFGTDLNQAINTINSNFAKLISVPFLKGAHGESVELRSLPLLNGQDFTKLGKAVFDSIYSSNGDPIEYDSLCPELDIYHGGTVRGSHSYDELSTSNPEIAFYCYVERNPNKETLVVASQQIFIFLDSRIGKIEDIDAGTSGSGSGDSTEYRKSDFEDLSCALTITGTISIDRNTGEMDMDSDDTEFKVVKHNIVPTLYYDGDENYGNIPCNEWCWKINGKKTKIPAQGLNGTDGKDADCIVCAGTLITENDSPFQVNISQILTPGGFVDDLTLLRNGQLAIVWYYDTTRESSNTENWNCTFGPIDYTGNTPKVYVGHYSSNNLNYINCDLLTAIGNSKLRGELDDICNTENTPGSTTSGISCRGIWVPDKFVYNPYDQNNPSQSSNIHMIWSDNSDVTHAVHFGFTSYGNSFGTATPDTTHTDTPDEYDSTFEFHYNKVKKDFIEAGREHSFDGYDVNISEIDPGNSGQSPLITSSTEGKGNDNIHQYILSKSSDDDTKMTAITSTGFILRGEEDDPLYSIMIDSEKEVINSKVTISNTGITITGASQPSNIMSPLTTAQEAKANLQRSDNIVVNKSNVIFNNTNLLVGANLGGDSRLNAYMNHYGNALMFNYDFLEALSRTTGGILPDTYISLDRPRLLTFIPVAIGGLLTLYSSQTTNKTENTLNYCGDSVKYEPIAITRDENLKHTFLSGKYGWTRIVETTKDVGSITGLSANTLNKIKTFYLFDSSSSNTRYGVTTSMSAIWTKIGNVVDVKGKIFFYGTKFKNNGGSSPTVIDDTYLLSYSQLFSFLMTNSDSISFPLPIVLSTENGNYISTGNCFNDINIPLSNIVSQQEMNKHLPSSNGIIRSEITSTTVNPNSVLNGSAQFHFFGNSNINPLPTTATRKGVIGSSSIEELTNVFTCTANLKVQNNTNWTFIGIPSDEILDGYDAWEMCTNKVGPIRFSDYQNSNHKRSNGANQTDSELISFYGDHKYNIIRPYATYRSINWDGFPYNSSVSSNDAWPLFSVTTIASYAVRYLTFQFSYLLDDDIYGATLSKDNQNHTNNWDSNWNILSAQVPEAIGPEPIK